MTDLDALIDDLADDASPVRSRSTRFGRLMLAAVAAVTLAVIALTRGFRTDIMAGQPAPMIAVAAGLMTILAIAAGASTVRMASPQVGAATSGAPWALASLLLVPAVAVIGIVAQPERIAGLDLGPGLRCLAFGLAAGLGSLAFLAAWLRLGAPVSPERASLLAGLASGAIGGLAVTLECRHEGLAHLGMWHVAVPLAAAVAARLILPRFLRW